jgi:hypothetical protein
MVFELKSNVMARSSGEFNHSTGEALRFGGFGFASEQFGIVVLQHPNVGIGGNNDGIVVGKT